MKDFLWHALHVRRRFERFVAFRLNQQSIENYLPLLRLSRQSRDGMSSIELLLFPGYVFCKFDARRPPWTIPGVLAVASGANAIDFISEQEIRDLRRIVNAGLPLHPWRYTSSGMKVMLQNGPLRGAAGILKQISGKRLLIVSIPLIFRSVAVELAAGSIVSLHNGGHPKSIVHPHSFLGMTRVQSRK